MALPIDRPLPVPEAMMPSLSRIPTEMVPVVETPPDSNPWFCSTPVPAIDPASVRLPVPLMTSHALSRGYDAEPKPATSSASVVDQHAAVQKFPTVGDARDRAAWNFGAAAARFSVPAFVTVPVVPICTIPPALSVKVAPGMPLLPP